MIHRHHTASTSWCPRDTTQASGILIASRFEAMLELTSGRPSRRTRGTRPDSRIKDDVIAELAWDPSIDASRIDTAVHEGVVRLSGTVGSYAQKYLSRMAAWRVTGVMGVVAGLFVELPEGDKYPDSDLVRAALSLLAWNASIPPHRIRVAVENSRVMLSGKVEWEFQRRAAECAIRNLVGITGLVNLIQVEPGIEPRDVTRSIEAALRRGSFERAKNVSVTMNGGTVTLCGQLDSPNERAAARMAAWRAPGVRNVVDQTMITA